MLAVPFSSDYDQTFTVELGGDGYIIAARWNERALRAYRRADFREVSPAEESRFVEMERPA